MKSNRFYGLLPLFLGAVIFIWLGVDLERLTPGAGTDFKELYFSGKCLLQHCDPYDQSELQNFYLKSTNGHPMGAPKLIEVVTVLINLPTVFTFVIPFSLLSWWQADSLWLAINTGSLILAALLTWNLVEDSAPRSSGVLLGILLVTSVSLFLSGNGAGIVVGTAVAGVWCLLKGRLPLVGVVCLAVSLVLKPNDAGLVWLYFLLAGGVRRKRALQSLVVAIALGLPGLLAVWHVSPNWMTELHSNLSWVSRPGGLCDPGLASDIGVNPDSVIDLRTITSVFVGDSGVYNLISYLLAGSLIFFWAAMVWKSKPSPTRDRFALASIAALSMLLGYHRQHDAKLLLLAFPAFALLWAEGGVIGWLALALTGGSLILDGDLTSLLRAYATHYLIANSAGLAGKLATVLLSRPVPLALTATGIFYLWVYWRRGKTPSTYQLLEDQSQHLLEPSPLEAVSPADLRPEIPATVTAPSRPEVTV